MTFGQRLEAREQQVEHWMALAELQTSITELTSAVRGQTVNKVLSSELVTIPAAGFWTRDFTVPFGSWALVNLGDGPMVVSNSPPGIGAPGAGVGSQKVPPGAAPVVNMAGSTITIYGTVGDQANLQIFVKPQPPTYSASGGSVSTAAVGTPTNVASSAASVTILAANPNRKGAVIYNDSTAVLYLLLSAAGPASITNYSVQVPAQAYFELPPPSIYIGQILGIWAAAAGFARVTELT